MGAATMSRAEQLVRDARGAGFVEYLVITGAVGLILVAAAAALSAGYGEALITRSKAAMGVN
jgi:Flp pilus assembly pilin Flp